MAEAFKQLIQRYAKGKKICNCGQAYETPCGEGIIDGKHRTDVMMCAWGCSANQINAKEYIAKEIIKEFKIKL